MTVGVIERVGIFVVSVLIVSLAIYRSGKE